MLPVTTQFRLLTRRAEDAYPLHSELARAAVATGRYCYGQCSHLATPKPNLAL